MKRSLLLTALWAVCLLVSAQSDPVIMTINGKPVARSEFEYSYNKNNTEGVIDKKTVDEYVDLFINYKLKVEAALDAKMDTMQSFQREFATYRDQQIRPAFITDADVERQARTIYRQTQQRIDGNGGLRRVAHLLIMVPQKASQTEMTAAKERVDSLYDALQRGEEFSALARKYSQDRGSAAQGGELPWLQRGMTLKEFDDVAFSLHPGETSKPFLSPAGWHIVKVLQARNFFPYDSVKTDIYRFIDQQGLRETMIDSKIDSLSRAAKPVATKAQILAAKRQEMEKKDPSLHYLIQEYHDGLLLYEISNRTVWDRAAKDEAGLENYFKQNKKRYKWDAPRFKGIAYHTKTKADLKKVKQTVKRLPFSEWAEKLRQTFNSDSVLRVRAEKGVFKQGDDKLVDREVFHQNVEVKPLNGYPYEAVYGKKLSRPKEMDDVRSQVVADYQEALEAEWVKTLRRKYVVQVNEDIVKTVNKH